MSALEARADGGVGVEAPALPANSCLPDKRKSGIGLCRGFVIIAETLTGSVDGFTKLNRFVQTVFRFISRLGAAGFEAGAFYFGAAASLGEAVDTFKRIEVLVKGGTGWAGNISSICWVAFRSIELAKFLDKLKFFNYGAVLTKIGNIPVVGKIGLLPIEVIGAAASVFDIVHHVGRLQSTIDDEKTEAEKAFECAQIKYNYFQQYGKHVKEEAYSTPYTEAAKALLEKRIALKKEENIPAEAITRRVIVEWNRFQKRVKSLVEDEIKAGSDWSAIWKKQRDRIAQEGLRKAAIARGEEPPRVKIEYHESEKVDITRQVLDYEVTRLGEAATRAKQEHKIDGRRSVLAILANVSRVAFLGFGLIGMAFAIPALAATSTIILTFAMISFALAVVQVGYDAAYKRKKDSTDVMPSNAVHYQNNCEEEARKLWFDLGVFPKKVLA